VKMTVSPFFTVNGVSLPLSLLRWPSPRATILPCLGFSLLDSGRKMPLSVFEAASSRFTRILSPRGRNFMWVSPCLSSAVLLNE